MHRKTDLYYIFEDSDTPELKRMGFRKGEAEVAVLREFRKFAHKRQQSEQRGTGQTKKKQQQQQLEGAAHSSEKKGSSRSNNKKNNAAAAPTVVAKKKKERGEMPPAQPLVVNDKSDDEADASSANATSNQRGEKNDSSSSSNSSAIATTQKQVPLNNGGVFETHYFTQSLTEASVYIPVPVGTRSKDIIFKLTATSLSVALKRGASAAPPLLSGVLGYKIKVDDSIWTGMGKKGNDSNSKRKGRLPASYLPICSACTRSSYFRRGIHFVVFLFLVFSFSFCSLLNIISLSLSLHFNTTTNS
jgi:hypothetical protein